MCAGLLSLRCDCRRTGRCSSGRLRYPAASTSRTLVEFGKYYGKNSTVYRVEYHNAYCRVQILARLGPMSAWRRAPTPVPGEFRELPCGYLTACWRHGTLAASYFPAAWRQARLSLPRRCHPCPAWLAVASGPAPFSARRGDAPDGQRATRPTTARRAAQRSPWPPPLLREHAPCDSHRWELHLAPVLRRATPPARRAWRHADHSAVRRWRAARLDAQQRAHQRIQRHADPYAGDRYPYSSRRRAHGDAYPSTNRRHADADPDRV